MDFDFIFMMVLKGYILGLFLACGLTNTIVPWPFQQMEHS
jgi:hypothetical protein